VIVHRHGQGLLGVLLADNVLVEEILYLARRGNRIEKRLTGGELAFFLSDDVVGQVDAIGADINIVGPFDHGSDVAGGLSAKAAGCDSAAAKAPGLIGGITGRRRVALTATAAAASSIGSGHRDSLPCRPFRRHD